MKKNTKKSEVKIAKKAVKTSIQQRLIKELTAITGLITTDAKKVAVNIEKESKKLAKKITKGLKPVLPVNEDKKAEAPKKAETPKKATTPKSKAQPAKTAAKAPEAKPVAAKAKTEKKPVEKAETKK